MRVTCLCSTIAGAAARLLLHPMDTLKAKLQVQRASLKPEFFSITDGVRFTLQHEGMRGFYRGITVSLTGSLPAVTLYFSGYELGKQILLSFPAVSASPFLAYLAGGLFAETVACVVFVPIDVIKERLQVQSNLKLYRYGGGVDAVRQIMKTEGLRGLYKAYGATVGSFGPFSALYFLFYEYFKQWTTHGQMISFSESLVCSGLAGSLASWITNPLDMAKLRMQVMRSAKATGQESHFNYRNMLHGVWEIATHEGVRALFRGALARVMFHTPNTAIVMSLMEYLRPKVEKMIE